MGAPLDSVTYGSGFPWPTVGDEPERSLQLTKVTDPDGVQTVTLDYQIVEPESYIGLTNAAFATNWTILPMRDDGQNGDALANDSLFSAQIPPEVQAHRRLISV
jgi:hypothetical protein